MPPRNSIPIPCAQCGKPLKRPKYRIERNLNQFCDHACKRALQIGKTNIKRRRRTSLTCERCGKGYSKALSQAVGSRFCSATCRNTAVGLAQQGEKNPHFSSVPVTCAACGAGLLRPARRVRIRQNHFCNHECKAKWQEEHLRGDGNPVYSRVERHCQQCGKQYMVNRHTAENNRWHFCCRPCYGKWRAANLVGKNAPSWKGGYLKYYGPDWPGQRRKARQRDNYRCQHCAVPEAKLGQELDVHHIKPFREFGIKNHRAANHLSNLICLCHACHRLAELQKIALQLPLLL